MSAQADFTLPENIIFSFNDQKSELIFLDLEDDQNVIWKVDGPISKVLRDYLEQKDVTEEIQGISQKSGLDTSDLEGKLESFLAKLVEEKVLIEKPR